MAMAVGTTPASARKRARDKAASLYDADDAERRRIETERRKRVLDSVAEIAANDAEIAQLTAKIQELQADSGRRLAAIIKEGVSEQRAAAMTEREPRDVKSAVKAAASAPSPVAPAKAAKKPAAAKAAVTEPAAA